LYQCIFLMIQIENIAITFPPLHCLFGVSVKVKSGYQSLRVMIIVVCQVLRRARDMWCRRPLKEGKVERLTSRAKKC